MSSLLDTCQHPKKRRRCQAQSHLRWRLSHPSSGNTRRCCTIVRCLSIPLLGQNHPILNIPSYMHQYKINKIWQKYISRLRSHNNIYYDFGIFLSFYFYLYHYISHCWWVHVYLTWVLNHVVFCAWCRCIVTRTYNVKITGFTPYCLHSTHLTKASYIGLLSI
jgi:hypothetical protein